MRKMHSVVALAMSAGLLALGGPAANTQAGVTMAPASSTKDKAAPVTAAHDHRKTERRLLSLYRNGRGAAINGQRERERRRRQIAAGQITKSNGLWVG